MFGGRNAIRGWFIMYTPRNKLSGKIGFLFTDPGSSKPAATSDSADLSISFTPMSYLSTTFVERHLRSETRWNLWRRLHRKRFRWKRIDWYGHTFEVGWLFHKRHG